MEHWMVVSTELQGKLENLQTELDRYKRFYAEVAKLTLRHDVLEDNAVVYPSKLGPLLETIDPLWYRKVKDQ